MEGYDLDLVEPRTLNRWFKVPAVPPAAPGCAIRRVQSHRRHRDLVEHWDDNPKPFVWHKTAEEIITEARQGRGPPAYARRITKSRRLKRLLPSR